MKRILIYLFCISTIFHSILGQFFLLDKSTGSFELMPTLITFITENIPDNAADPFEATVLGKGIATDEEGETIPSCTDGAEFLRDSDMDHLFSPFKVPNKNTSILIIPFSCIFEKNQLHILAFEEIINNFISFYSNFSKIIHIGLPATEVIYPFHTFY